MEIKMKKYAKLLVLALFAMALLLLLVACKPDAELSLKDDSMPQNVFVLGEDIDLSGGRITVKEGDETYELDMTAEGVSVSGYDKNTLGEQTVTLTYEGGSVSFKVTVVERMVAEDFTANYLVGDTLDLSKGRLKITRNDGSNYTVAFNSTKVKVEGFSSETVGECALVAKYSSDGKEYTASFTVNIREVENVVLTAPTKVTYKSHDAGKDLTGGFLTFYGMDGSIKREIPIAEDMISGFDLSAVNAQNSPLSQKVTVTYDNQEYTYDIMITYTSVSDFLDHCDFVDDINWDEWDAWADYETLPEVDDTVGAEAVRIMQGYFDMSPAEKVLLDNETVLKAARVAITWAFDEWSTDIFTFSDAFGVESGALVFYCVSEKAVEDAITELANTDRPIYNYAEVMADLVEVFTTESVFGEMLFENFPVIEAEVYDEIVTLFEYMLALDVKMDAIPENWREVGLADYGDEIDAVLDFIVNGDYYNYDYTQIFYLVSAWRAQDDAFDYLYSYYYGIEDVESLVYLANVRLPKELEEIYVYMLTALEQVNAISNYQAVDTSNLFYSIYMARTLSEQLLAGDDEMQQILYYSIPLNGMLGLPNSEEVGIYTFDLFMNELITGEGGYYHFSGTLLGISEYHELMDKYMSILALWFADEDGSYENSAAYGEDIEELLSLYMNLTSAQQFNFNSLINVFYGMNLPPLAFEAIGEYEGFESVFVFLLRDYYQSLLTSDEAKAAYVDLMVAAELFTQRYTNTEWKDEFVARLTSVRAAYGDMNDADKAIFETKLLWVLEKYENLNLTYGTGEVIDYMGWEAKFEELHKAMVNVELSYQIVAAGYGYYGIFLSAFERAAAIVEEIYGAPEEVINIYLYEGLYSNKELDKFGNPDWVDDDPSTTVYWSFDYLMGLYRSVYISSINSDILGDSMYDYYVEKGLGAFLNQAYDLIWAYMLSSDDDTDVYTDKASVLALLESFRNLDLQSQMLFIVYIEGMGSGLESLYLAAVSDFLGEEYSEAVASAADYMLYLELSYMSYMMLEDTDSLEALKADLADTKAVCEALEGDDETAFTDDFKTAYDLIVQKVEEAIAAAETPEEAPAA